MSKPLSLTAWHSSGGSTWPMPMQAIWGPWVKIAETDPATWWKNWEINVQGTYHVIRYALPHLIESAKRHARVAVT